jgi:hypothetical protein
MSSKCDVLAFLLQTHVQCFAQIIIVPDRNAKLARRKTSETLTQYVEWLDVCPRTALAIGSDVCRQLSGSKGRVNSTAHMVVADSIIFQNIIIAIISMIITNN